MDRQMQWLLGGLFLLLLAATAVGRLLSRRAGPAAMSTVRNLNARITAWWGMCVLFTAALLLGRVSALILFGALSILALREFLPLTPARPGDARTLLWIFLVIIPLQYVLVGIESDRLFSILIPVYAFLFLPIRSALAGDTERFLERTSEIQWGLMVCVYCVSHAPALLMLRIPGYEGQNPKLLFFLVLVAELSDVLQYVWGKCLGRRKIAPTVSPNKTWEGFLGGVGSVTVVGALLHGITPFSPRGAAAMALLIALFGFAGGLTMSAIKRDRGIKDYGSAIPGHGGILDRIDSLCFAAPVFFHLTRYFFSIH